MGLTHRGIQGCAEPMIYGELPEAVGKSSLQNGSILEQKSPKIHVRSHGAISLAEKSVTLELLDRFFKVLLATIWFDFLSPSAVKPTHIYPNTNIYINTRVGGSTMLSPLSLRLAHGFRRIPHR